ncbi:oxidoreductase [Streptomyces aquilus]|uniref:Oxidoreductase n=1 Tax=Streptomyces aquilus TaxID=2548456 RepID=A0A3S9I471_9ACTN|nr:FAD-dependent oxidoreductase [Streptomyces aquilus]AZP19147.1 oxidoreductase [Streptomyces aquilus]
MKHRIVVLGAGYAGATAAGRIARRLRREDVRITLVNAEPDFVERVRMHQLATGQELKPRPLADVFKGTGVEVRIARVTSVDTDAKTVTVTAAGTEDRLEYEYDTLVYALGSGWTDQGVPGVTDHAHQIASRPGALRLRERLTELTAGAPVVVVGGGLTGLELATELAESRPDLDIALVARDGLGAWLSPKGRAHVRKVAEDLGITVHEHTTVTAVEADAVRTDAGELPAAVTIWTAGFAVHPLAAATSLKVTDTGRIIVDATMRSVSHPDVYAIGDAAYALGHNDKPLRMSCASGIPAAWHAADVIAARLTGTKVPHTVIGYTHQCISLGRNQGLIQMVTPDDTVKDRAWTGRGAARYKELICKGAYWSVAKPVMYPVRRRKVVGQRVGGRAFDATSA